MIRRIADDLRTCRIEAWYDEWEIPPGVSFQRKIFDDGIPNCDTFFVYLTKHSIKSYWVQKELDAIFIEQSRRKNVGVITFADYDETRRGLPSDLASLNTPIINPENYQSGIIKLIARIYEAKLERVSTEKSLEQENVRLRLEKEVESLQRQILSLQHDGVQSIEYIHDKLSGRTFRLKADEDEVSSVEIFEVICSTLATGATEQMIGAKIESHYKIPKSGKYNWGLPMDGPTSLNEILSPLIINFLVDVQRPDTGYAEFPLLFLSDLGKRFAVYLEEKK